jgi:hypothetical protein
MSTMGNGTPGRFPERIETERLVLRRWHEDDQAAVMGIWADLGVWRAIGPGVTGVPFDMEWTRSGRSDCPRKRVHSSRRSSVACVSTPR